MAFDNSSSDLTLARAAHGGSREAFEELARRHYVPIHRFLLSLLGNRSDAEDLTQDTFLRALAKIHHFNPERPFRPWVFTMARHLAISHWRRQRPTTPLDESIPDPVGSPTVSRHDAAALWALARQHLKANEFSALWCYYREDMPVKEIAKVLRKTVTHTKVILHRARTHLRTHLEPDAWQPGPLPHPATQATP